MNDTTVIARVSGEGQVNGEHPVKKKLEKSIALGAHSMRTRDLLPVNDDEWIIFGLNNLHRFIPRGHLWIQCHSPEYLAKHPAYSKEDITFYESMKIPLFTNKVYPQWPTSTRIPIERLQQKWPRINWDSSMCYMVGLSILMIEEGWFPGDLNDECVPAKRFGMWGLDMLDNYAKQGPNVAYLISYADHVGIEVVVPRQAGFFRRTWIYGFDEKAIGQRRSQIETRKVELNTSLQQLNAKAQGLTGELNNINQRIIALQAAMGENEYQLKNWVLEDDEVSPAETLKEATEKQKSIALTGLGGNAQAIGE